MDYVGTILLLLEKGLSLWEQKEANKYRDSMIRIKKDYYDEKGKADPDMAVLDRLEFELRILCESFAASAGATPTPNPSK